MSGTGENEVGLGKILDFTRLAAIAILMPFYYYCYKAFKEWNFTASISDRLMMNIANTGLFKHWYTSKIIALELLIISLVGATGKKNEKLRLKSILSWIAIGLLFLFRKQFVLGLTPDNTTITVVYMTGSGWDFYWY